MESQKVKSEGIKSTLEAARDYARRGFAVIPCDGKAPRIKAWQHRGAPTAKELAEWKRQGWLDDGQSIGIVCGETSGNLVIFDTDEPAAYTAFEAKFPDLAETYTVASGSGRGRHYYFRVDLLPETTEVKHTPIGNLELKSTGRQCIAPPSRHEDTGQPYTVAKSQPIKHVTDLSELVNWIQSFPPKETKAPGRQDARTHDNGADTPLDYLHECGYVKAVMERLPARARDGKVTNCPSPTHDDEHPSFRVSYDDDPRGRPICSCSNNRGIPWITIGEWVGLPWEDYKANRIITRPAANGNKPHTNGSAAPYQSDTLARALNDPLAENITPFPASAPRLTDTGNAQRLVARHGANLRYIAMRDKWLVWTGQRWEYDELGTIRQWAKETTRAMLKEAADIPDDEKSKAHVAHALKSQGRDRIRAMIELAQDEPGIPVKVAHLDANPWLMGVGNGTLDLKTGELKAQTDRGDLVTKHTSIPFDESATAPIWTAFLERIMEGDSERIYYLQKAIGYTLTGDVSENVFFLAYGTGANGKTVLLETISRLLGDYSKKARFDTFVRKAFEAGGPTSDIARLVGARFVYAVEANEGQRFNEALIKELTGGDKQTASFKYENEFEFYPTLKLWLAANHKPVIRGTDLGIWRRVHLIPFNVTIPKSEQDKQLDLKLRAELPGILAWAVRGCLAWQCEGLGAPEAITNATEAYRAEQDSVLQFVTESCYIGTTQTPTKASDLWAAYKTYCQESNIHPIGRNKFYERIVTINGISQADFAGKQRAFLGVGLLSEHEG